MNASLNGTMVSPLEQPALAYLTRGWSIIPTDNNKTAVGKWKDRQTTRVTADALRHALRNPRVAGIAVILGAVSGDLYNRDFDDPESYRRWAKAHPVLARQLPTAKSGRGYHVYGRWTGVRTHPVGDGEIRGESNYVLLPPSRHPSGAVYEWITPPPEGDVPEVDPVACGLAEAWTDEDADTRRKDVANTSEFSESPVLPVSSVSSALSAPSVFPALSVSSAPSVSADDPRVQQAIASTVPAGIGQRHTLLFEFLRRLAAIPELKEAPTAAIRALVAAWHKRAVKFVGTKDWDATWSDAVSAWPEIHTPHGTIEGFVQRARERPDPPCAAGYERPEVKLLIRLCGELQIHHGERPFFLDCRTAGKAVGIDHTTAWKFLNMLCADGVLHRVLIGKRRTASEYRYLGGPDPERTTT
jgi:hypothetical protein